jgi:phasin family protein
MTFPDKLSDAGKQQLATHLDFFQSLTARMFENAERILALNIEATRNTLDQASGAARQLAAAKDPRDLLSLGNQSQQQVEAVMAYSRKLLEIANRPASAATPAATPAAAPAPAPAPAAAPAADTAAPAPEEHIQTAPPVMVAEPAPEPAAQAAPAHSATLASEHPLGEADSAPAPAPAIPAKATSIAEAASQVAAAPLEMPHPAASPVPDAGPVTIPAITPVDATPAPAEAAAPPGPKRAKGARKR